MTQSNDYPDIDYVVVHHKRRAWWKRPSCLVQLILWMSIMMLPAVFMVLAFQGDITFYHRGDIPNKFQHPFLQVKLIMEEDYRGLSLTNASVLHDDADNLCVETSIRFLLWEGQGEPATYCQCYTRSNEAWQPVDSEQGTCRD
jgi:hypothetical protein